MKQYFIIICILLLGSDLSSSISDSRQYPAIYLYNGKPLPVLELPLCLKQDSISGRLIFQLSVSAKSLKINKFAILDFRLINKYSGKEIFVYTQMRSSSPTEYNWNHYPLTVRKYKPFLFSNVKNIKFYLDYSPAELKNNEWQIICGLIEFK
jgi:hypothetical protein